MVPEQGKNEPKELHMISVVVPIYNEEEIIPRLHDAVVGAMSKLRDPWEVVYVNDGSKDSTLQLLRTLQLNDIARRGCGSFAQLGAHGCDLCWSADRRRRCRRV